MASPLSVDFGQWLISALGMASLLDGSGQWRISDCGVKAVFICQLFKRPKPTNVAPEIYTTSDGYKRLSIWKPSWNIQIPLHLGSTSGFLTVHTQVLRGMDAISM